MCAFPSHHTDCGITAWLYQRAGKEIGRKKLGKKNKPEAPGQGTSGSKPSAFAGKEEGEGRAPVRE